jgi:hypothetical protein
LQHRRIVEILDDQRHLGALPHLFLESHEPVMSVGNLGMALDFAGNDVLPEARPSERLFQGLDLVALDRVTIHVSEWVGFDLVEGK